MFVDRIRRLGGVHRWGRARLRLDGRGESSITIGKVVVQSTRVGGH
jgi:hypothetical protein